MIWFPILSGVFSILFAVTLIVPSFVLDVLGSVVGHEAVGPIRVVVLFATYFGLSAIATFFNVCVVYTTRVRLSGGDATFMDSIRFSFSRLGQILGWSLISATVGILLHGLDSLGRRLGLPGKILLWILRTVLASAWSLMTVFVIPSMVYRELGPIDAIKDSWETLKQTWGETVIGYWGVGLAAFVCALPAFALVALGIAVAGSAPLVGLGLIGLGLLALVGVSLVFGVVSAIYRTALYHWATTQVVPAAFDATALQSAFRR